MQDPTEGIRRFMTQQVNADTSSRDVLEAEYGQVWDTQQLSEEFEMTGFMARGIAVSQYTLRSSRVSETLCG